MKKLIPVILTLLISSCGEPLWTAMIKDLSTLDNETLCEGYEHSGHKSQRLYDELKARNVIPENEWKLIKAKKIRADMSELGLVCSWGSAKKNTSTGSWGKHVQYVYYSKYAPDRIAQIVYVRNGKVSSWQQ